MAISRIFSLADVVVTGIGSSVDGLTSLSDLDEELYWRDLRENLSQLRFQFNDATQILIEALDEDANWSNGRTFERQFRNQRTQTYSRSRFANRIFKNRDFGGVLFLEFTYFLTPELDQIRMVVQTAGYTPKTIEPSRSSNVFSNAVVESPKPDQAFEVTYEYFSPSQGLVLRPWKEGEKQALIAAIEDRYETKLARYPHNKKAYKKDRKTALSILRNRDVILVPMAMREGWPDEDLADTLEQAIAHMTSVIQSDLRYFSEPEEPESETLEFDYIDWRGTTTKLQGSIVDERDGQVIYRDKRGNLYSMPQA